MSRIVILMYKNYYLPIFCVMIGIILIVPLPAYAAESIFCNAESPFSIETAHSDGVTRAIIRCAFADDPADMVIVYDRNSNMRDTGAWQTATDFTDDLWIFDAGGDGKANLIIDFQREGMDLVARLYDDQNGDGQVSYRVAMGRVEVTESPFWTVEVRVKGDWLGEYGQPNFNLDIRIDGPVMAMESFDRFLNLLATDGQVDFVIEVRDPLSSGRPQYDFRYSTAPLPLDWGLRRVNLAVDEGYPQSTGSYFDYSLLWPLLGSANVTIGDHDSRSYRMIPYYDDMGRTYGLVQEYNRLAPPLQIVWSRSKLVFVAEVLPTRATESGWFSYAHDPYVYGKPYQLNFEAPFAFYDLAADGDGIPELAVRTEYYPENDSYFKHRRIFPWPFTMTRYSWDQDNDGLWDYSVDLLARKGLMQVDQSVGTHIFRTTPYEKYSDEVLQTSWDAISLVEHMRGGLAGQEGIYMWSEWNSVRDSLLTGDSDEPDLRGFEYIEEGYRGEYTVRTGLEPRIYLSPMDNMLHLLNAEYGLWNIDGTKIMRYTNSGTTAYIDRWQLIEHDSEVVLEDLIVAENYLIFSDDAGLRVRRADVQPALFITTPPATHEEWLKLGDKLRTSHSSALMVRPLQILQQVFGDELMIRDAHIEAYRVTENGFRFQLRLLKGFQVEGEDWIGVRKLEPGDYVVTYNGDFSVEPMQYSGVQITGFRQNNDQPVIALSPQRLQVDIQNQGNVDLAAVRVLITARSSSDITSVLTTTTISVLANETVQLDFTWLPPDHGNWLLVATAENSAEYLLNLNVQAPDQITVAKSFGMLTGQNSSIVLLLLLTIVYALVFGFFFRQDITSSNEGIHE